MRPLAPLETLTDAVVGDPLPLSEALRAVVGPLRFALPVDRPLVIGNFVTTLDGVVALGEGVGSGGSEISGANPHDRALMGLLRAAADVVVVGAGTVRATPRHAWTPESAYPAFAAEYRALRNAVAKGPLPHRVVVTSSGEVDLRLPAFLAEPWPTLVLTTERGETRLRRGKVPDSVRVVATSRGDKISARSIVDEAVRSLSSRLILVEGGPQVLGQFVEERLLDELFLTLAPQIAGRDGKADRPGLVSGRLFAPHDSRWATLTGVKRGDSHLFLRYRFDR